MVLSFIICMEYVLDENKKGVKKDTLDCHIERDMYY